MSQHTPNELTEIFKRDHELISKLKQDNAHYAKLADEYHEVNRAIHRAETEVEPTDDFHLEDMKKERLALKDELAGILHG